MPAIQLINGQLKRVIPLQVKPFKEQAIPSIIGSITSKEAGTVMYGYYGVDYHLPNGDYLRMLANHNKQTLQIVLMTSNAGIIKRMPGERPASLVANAIAMIRGYSNRSKSYAQPLSPAQSEKFKIAKACIDRLEHLLEQERRLASRNWSGQEQLRAQVIHIIENYRNMNLQLTLDPVISEGYLGSLLYETAKMAQHYEFNRLHEISRLDQMDFSGIKADTRNIKPTFVWDSSIHIGQNKELIYETIRVISDLYKLEPSKALSRKPAGRFERFESYFAKLWRHGEAWIEHLAEKEEPEQTSNTVETESGLKITSIDPFYYFEGPLQKPEPAFDDFLHSLNITMKSTLKAKSRKEAKAELKKQKIGAWVAIPHQRIVVKEADKIAIYSYFIYQGHYYLRPREKDLVKICQLAKDHLFFHQKLKLQFQAFLSRIPAFFVSWGLRIKRYIFNDLYNEFKDYVHSNHSQPEAAEAPVQADETKATIPDFALLTESLKNHQLLPNGQSIEDFIRHHLQDNHIVIARPTHLPSPKAYNNPLHRVLNVSRHMMSFFVDTSEKNPILGTLALAAYVYGGAAIIAPDVLTSVLTKLHMNGLIYGIKPTQIFAHWMSHNHTSEAISAAASYWQGIVVGGNLDEFFVRSIEVLREHPAEIAIVLSLALSLGYGLSKMIPALSEDQGDFPFASYAAVGGKAAGGIYDTLMFPGEDWLLGTIKWLLKHGLTLIKFFICPLIEWHFYGFKNGFFSGLLKSGLLFLSTLKQSIAAITDLVLALMTIPFMEISSMLIHVPFRGITSFISRSLAILGRWQPIGEALVSFALRKQSQNILADFHLSVLYGFGQPWKQYSNNKYLNGLINSLRFPFYMGFQLVKNVVILPLSDMIFLGLRFTLATANLATRILAYSGGHLIKIAGIIWDNTIGQLFQAVSMTVTLCANAIDSLAGQMRQFVLGKIQVARRKVYDLGFGDLDTARDTMNTDPDYCMDDPVRIEQLSKDSTHSLMKILLNRSVLPEKASGEGPVFAPVPDCDSQSDEESGLDDFHNLNPSSPALLP